MTEALDLFISYAEKDEEWLDQLEEQLAHDGEVFDRADVWIDPGHGRGIEPSPHATDVSLTSANSVVTHVGIRTHGLLNARKRLLLGGLKIGGSWSEVA